VSAAALSAMTSTVPVQVATGAPVMYAGVAAIGLGLVGVVAAFGLSHGSGAGTSDVEERINSYGKTKKSATATPSSFAEAATQKTAEALASNKSLEAKIAGRLDGAGYSMKPAEWVLLHSALFVFAGLLFLLLTGGKIGFLVLGLVLGAVLPWVYLGRKRNKRLTAFQSQLPETLQLMAGSLSAGLSLAQSLDTIVREGTEPITSEFKRVTVEGRLGVTLEDAMEGVAQRMESKDFEWVVMAIRIQREVGGNLAELLLTVAGTLREREYIRRHVRALSAEGRLSMYVLGGLPPVFLAYLSLSKWSYVSPLFTTPIGYMLCGVMSVLLSVGVFWMSKVAKVEL
jgi:tight adherence protein B